MIVLLLSLTILCIFYIFKSSRCDSEVCRGGKSIWIVLTADVANIYLSPP